MRILGAPARAKPCKGMSVPDWYEPLDRLMSVGQLSMTAMADAQHRASGAAIHDQERAGIDLITGGEMHRRTHNRHSPPNAMLNYFWQKIPAFQGPTQPSMPKYGGRWLWASGSWSSRDGANSGKRLN